VALKLYAHPFSSYCQKVLIALYEHQIAFDYRLLDGGPEVTAELEAAWPIGKFPVLVDGDRVIAESSIIIEYLDRRSGPRLIPPEADAALEVRFMDRFFDNHVMSVMQEPVFEVLRTDGSRRDQIIARSGERLDIAYRWLEARLAGRDWAAGAAFSLADCAAAPSLFYANWIREIGPDFPTLLAYRQRLRERPSVHRTVEEARPYRSFFPLGAPDRE
jgi:glutathione S-transferase